LKLRKIFLYKVHALNRPLTTVQWIETSCVSGKMKAQPIGVQRLKSAPVSLVILLPAIFAIAQQWMAGGGELSPYLMGSSGDKVALQQGQALPGGQGAVECHGCLAAGDGSGIDLYLGFLFIFDNVSI